MLWAENGGIGAKLCARNFSVTIYDVAFALFSAKNGGQEAMEAKKRQL